MTSGQLSNNSPVYWLIDYGGVEDLLKTYFLFSFVLYIDTVRWFYFNIILFNNKLFS